MRVSYAPSRTMEEYVRKISERDYTNRYVIPLGRPRKNVRLAGDDVILEFDPAGAMGAVPTFVELAAGCLTNMEWEAVEESPGTGWWGDLEPGAPTFYMERKGPRIELSEGFSYAPPPQDGRPEPAPEPDFALSLGVRDQQGEKSILCAANAAAFLTLAKRVVDIAQPAASASARTEYREVGQLEDGNSGVARRLVITAAEFSRDVPWARFATVA